MPNAILRKVKFIFIFGSFTNSWMLMDGRVDGWMDGSWYCCWYSGKKNKWEYIVLRRKLVNLEMNTESTTNYWIEILILGCFGNRLWFLLNFLDPNNFRLCSKHFNEFYGKTDARLCSSLNFGLVINYSNHFTSKSLLRSE